tara:strand:- start:290 stop:463 length:174 start_codon:yes stop_codon:yes gene_type:complete
MKKQEAELKNRIINTLIAYLDDSQELMLADADNFDGEDTINAACSVIRNALERRKSA